MTLAPWEEYADLVDGWDDYVGANPCPETYRERWQARLRHPSWEQTRQSFLWYTNIHCERCGTRPPTEELQLHHLHYETLWYENNADLELLCRRCHRIADNERAEQALRQHRGLGVEERARAYMDAANRWSDQPNWPVTYRQAIAKVTQYDDHFDDE